MNLCQDCKWVRGLMDPKCNHPDMQKLSPGFLATGRPDNSKFARDCRSNDDMCGLKGKLFESKQ